MIWAAMLGKMDAAGIEKRKTGDCPLPPCDDCYHWRHGSGFSLWKATFGLSN
jgi:hypothetical protein